MQVQDDNCHTGQVKDARQGFKGQDIGNNPVPGQPGGQTGQHFPKGSISRGRGLPARIFIEGILRKIGDQLSEGISAIYPYDPAMEDIVIDIQGVERGHEQKYPDEGQGTSDDNDPGGPAPCLSDSAQSDNVANCKPGKSQDHTQIGGKTGILQHMPIQASTVVQLEYVDGQSEHQNINRQASQKCYG